VLNIFRTVQCPKCGHKFTLEKVKREKVKAPFLIRIRNRGFAILTMLVLGWLILTGLTWLSRNMHGEAETVSIWSVVASQIDWVRARF